MGFISLKTLYKQIGFTWKPKRPLAQGKLQDPNSHYCTLHRIWHEIHPACTFSQSPEVVLVLSDEPLRTVYSFARFVRVCSSLDLPTPKCNPHHDDITFLASCHNSILCGGLDLYLWKQQLKKLTSSSWMFCFRFIFLSIFSWANFCRVPPSLTAVGSSSSNPLASWNRVSHADASSAGMDRQPITKVRRPGWQIFFFQENAGGSSILPPKAGWMVWKFVGSYIFI